MKAKLTTLLLMGLIATSFTSCDKDPEYKDAVEIVDKTNMIKEAIDKAIRNKAQTCKLEIGTTIKETYNLNQITFESNNTVKIGNRLFHISELKYIIQNNPYYSKDITPTFVF